MGRERLHPALAWICDANETPVGAGTLVGPKQMLTCAHVVASALGVDVVDAAVPGDAVLHVRFTHADDEALRRARVRPDRWFPPGEAEGDPGKGDVALLDLLDDPPAKAGPMPPFIADLGTGEVVWAFGLPPGHGAESGGWASGELAGKQASGWVQIDSPPEGYRIQPGFSGGAAWSDVHDAPAGMVVAAEKSPERVAWMIPAPLVAKLCSEVTVEATQVAPAAPTKSGPRIVKVMNRPPPPPDEIYGDEEARDQWQKEWIKTAKIAVNLGSDDGVTVGDYFDVLAKHEPVEEAGKVIGFVDESGSLIRAVEVQESLSVCQLENFAVQSFFDHVVPARRERLALAEDDEISPDLYADLVSPVAEGQVVKAIPSAEKDARDEVEELHERSLDDDLSEDARQETYREMVRCADRFFMRFPTGYFAGRMLYLKGYAQIKSREYRKALDTFVLYRERYPFGSTEDAEGFIAEAKAALRGTEDRPSEKLPSPAPRKRSSGSVKSKLAPEIAPTTAGPPLDLLEKLRSYYRMRDAVLAYVRVQERVARYNEIADDVTDAGTDNKRWARIHNTLLQLGGLGAVFPDRLLKDPKFESCVRAFDEEHSKARDAAAAARNSESARSTRKAGKVATTAVIKILTAAGNLATDCREEALNLLDDIRNAVVGIIGDEEQPYTPVAATGRSDSTGMSPAAAAGAQAPTERDTGEKQLLGGVPEPGFQTHLLSKGEPT